MVAQKLNDVTEKTDVGEFHEKILKIIEHSYDSKFKAV